MYFNRLFCLELDMRYVLAIILGLMLFSCSDNDSNKNNPIVPTDNNTTFSFDSLVIENKSISIEESTPIKAYARGFNLKYKWECSQGGVIGYGAKVNFALCHETKVIITCTVTDGIGNSKSITDSLIVFRKIG